jgi:predicted regulator of Ras-like GTPase activity (Roadblock/LC7/MglB family)
MDAAQALADLTEISSQIRAAVIFDETGAVAGTTLPDEARAKELAERAAELLRRAQAVRGETAQPTQLEVATSDGSVFVVRQNERRIVATTGPQPTSGLVFYDLKSALRQMEEKPQPPEEKPKPPPRRRRAPAKASDAADPPKKPPAPRKKAPPRKKQDAP